MARIIYGVAGEGSGHSSRSREIIAYLQSRGHTVKVVSYDRGYRNLCDKFDVFETEGGQFLVNEMQCIFGQSDPYQMLVDGEPGRYVERNGQWEFEAGDFNRLESFLLRLDHFIEILMTQKETIIA